MACMHISSVKCSECILNYPVQGSFTPPIITQWYEAREHCPEHCYCQEELVVNKDHDKCCMCGHRKLKSETNQKQ